MSMPAWRGCADPGTRSISKGWKWLVSQPRFDFRPGLPTDNPSIVSPTPAASTPIESLVSSTATLQSTATQSQAPPPTITATNTPRPTSTSTPEPSPTTSPAVVFAVLGDYGSGDQNEADVAELVLSWQPDFIITLGDNNYPSGAADTHRWGRGTVFSQLHLPLSRETMEQAQTKTGSFLPWGTMI